MGVNGKSRQCCPANNGKSICSGAAGKTISVNAPFGQMRFQFNGSGPDRIGIAANRNEWVLRFWAEDSGKHVRRVHSALSRNSFSSASAIPWQLVLVFRRHTSRLPLSPAGASLWYKVRMQRWVFLWGVPVVSAPAKNVGILAGLGRSQGSSRDIPVGWDAVRTLHEFLN